MPIYSPRGPGWNPLHALYSPSVVLSACRHGNALHRPASAASLQCCQPTDIALAGPFQADTVRQLRRRFYLVRYLIILWTSAPRVQESLVTKWVNTSMDLQAFDTLNKTSTFTIWKTSVHLKFIMMHNIKQYKSSAACDILIAVKSTDEWLLKWFLNRFTCFR